MSELATLFEKYKAVTPQFEVIEAKSLPTKETGHTSDTIGTTGKADNDLVSEEKQCESLSRPPRGPERRKPRDHRETRTVFVGNIPCTCTRKQVQRLFKTYGKVETVRLRCLQVKEGKLPKKIAVRTHKQLTEESTFNAYIVFSSEEEAEKSLKMNGTLLGGRHLRVDLVAKKGVKPVETQMSVFVGNLPFTADEEKLRSCFSDCGDVESVRIIRDAKTGIGKGFGFVSFADKSGVMFAVRQNRKIELDGRKLRVFKSKDEQTLKLQKQKFSGLRTAKPSRKKQGNDYLQSDGWRDTSLKKKGGAVRQGIKTSSHKEKKMKVSSKRLTVKRKPAGKGDLGKKKREVRMKKNK